ncbi:mesoderm induction early response protein 2 isoform X4 [Ascaphus truei]|uniref:mesoderm induction early response protein 2 isoform X4 n=1 Tax=Ascaphus truei TaxID=8439 RepID=UPI003F59F8A5
MHRSHPGHAAPPAPVRGVAETHSPFGSFHFLVFILITNFPKKQNPTERVAIAGEGLSLAGILTRKCGGHGAEDEQEGALSWGNGEMGRSFPDTQEGELAFNELLAFYGYEASDPLSDPEGESEEFDTSASQDLEQKAKGGVPESGEMPPCGTPSLSPHSTNSLSPACHKEAATPLSLSSEDPQDRTLSPDVGEKEMMVGSQAQLPFLRYTPAGERDYENVDQLLWDPSILPECEVEEYLSRASERQREVWEGSPFDESRVKDNEQALYELVRCRFHTEEALRRLHFNVKVVQAIWIYVEAFLYHVSPFLSPTETVFVRGARRSAGILSMASEFMERISTSYRPTRCARGPWVSVCSIITSGRSRSVMNITRSRPDSERGNSTGTRQLRSMNMKCPSWRVQSDCMVPYTAEGWVSGHLLAF